jgi:hypothetical protein
MVQERSFLRPERAAVPVRGMRRRCERQHRQTAHQKPRLSQIHRIGGRDAPQWLLGAIVTLFKEALEIVLAAYFLAARSRTP